MSNLIYAHDIYALQTGDPSTPSTGLADFYLKFSDSEVHLFTKDALGAVRRVSLPSGTNGYVLKHNGTSWVSNDDLKITATEVVINDNGSSLFNFRVESDTLEHILFVHSANNVIGINNDLPSSENIIDIAGNKPLKLPTVTSLNIALITHENGQILHNKSDRGFVGVINTLNPEWRRLDNPINHTGYGIRVESALYVASQYDHVIIGDLTGGDFTIYLPVAPINEQKYVIKRINGIPGNILTVDGNGYNIDGASTKSLTTTGIYLLTAITVVFSSTTSEWHVISNTLG